ncbi:TauD/TfdA dioxygenase family protein [Candidatus Poriferisocius sp.]|uniref:TauD/TfdA dioxygenase family protein n=1 Tax=Candidatus Poriferisocius sp. TaxID=3101276 RepID=UPI003B0110C1
MESETGYRHLAVERLGGCIGAEISNVDLRADLPDEVVAEIRRAWLTHLVVFFRDQPLTLDQFSAFARRIGTPGRYPFVPGLPGHPEIIEVKKLPGETVNFGGIWHSDTAYLERPPMASLLLAREVPTAGGDTEFANMYAAYDALSDGLKRFLRGLGAVNSSALADVSRTREDRMAEAAITGYGEPEDAVITGYGEPEDAVITGYGEPEDAVITGYGEIGDYEAVHPVVRTHPETGRPALYVNVAHTARFESMTEEESQPLLGFLFAHQSRPEFTCRFRWEVGSLALWDNRCTMHNPINDYHGRCRIMHRITLEGDEPR